jgi:hypothetical protein
VKLIECMEDLQSWDDYQDFMKVQLKLLAESGEPFFVSKEKVDFEIAGKPWSGFALLVGEKGAICKRKLQTEGLLFREGTCSREGKELRVEGLDPKLVKGAAKTLKKLLVGFKIAGADDESDSAASPDDAGSSEQREKRMADLNKLKSDLDRLLKVLNK